MVCPAQPPMPDTHHPPLPADPPVAPALASDPLGWRYRRCETAPARRRMGLASGALVLLCIGCGATRPVEPTARPAHVAQPPRAPTTAPVEAATQEVADLYSAQEALQDVLSGELVHLGTGRWTGIERLRACAFHNERVLVVNVYCTVSDSHAFRVDIFSPERGYVRIYAEANGPISVRDRALYFTFTAASEPRPSAETGLPPLTLGMAYRDLQRYDEERYEAFLPGCYGGEQHERKVGGCFKSLEGHEARWTERHSDFLQEASGEWYSVLRQLRGLASRYGRDPD